MAFTDYMHLAVSHRRTLGFGFLFAFFSSPGQTFVISLFVPSINAAFELEAATLGTLVSFATLTGALMLPFLGRFIDSVPIRRYGALVALFLACACALAAAAPALPVLFVALVGLRLGGQGLMTHTAATVGGRYFGAARGKALGLISIGHSVGEALFPITVVTLIALLGWRGGYLALGAALLLVCLPASLLLVRGIETRPPPPRPANAPPETPAAGEWSRRDVVRSGYFYAMLPATLCYGFISTGIIFHQTLIAFEKGWAMEWMALSFVAYAVASIVGLILIGPATDRYSARRLYPYHLLPLCLGLGVLAVGDHPLMATLFFVLNGLSSGAARTLRTAVWAEAYGTRHLGAVRSLIASLQSLSTALAPGLFGWAFVFGVGVDGVVMASLALVAVSSLLAWAAPDPSHSGRQGERA